MAGKKKRSERRRQAGLGLAAAVIAGGIGVIAGVLALGRRGQPGSSGLGDVADRALGRSEATESDRAPDQFRPDPTADIPADRRDAFAPATMPNPMTAEPVV